jgi:hypothetical protein
LGVDATAMHTWLHERGIHIVSAGTPAGIAEDGVTRLGQ